MPELKPGNKVTIFIDPMTEQDPEGEAVLVKLLMIDLQGDPPLDYWRVRFLEDNSTVDRFIKRR
jgi:hypothetical protein